MSIAKGNYYERDILWEIEDQMEKDNQLSMLIRDILIGLLLEA